jgi:hypothetical protein
MLNPYRTGELFQPLPSAPVSGLFFDLSPANAARFIGLYQAECLRSYRAVLTCAAGPVGKVWVRLTAPTRDEYLGAKGYLTALLIHKFIIKPN